MSTIALGRGGLRDCRQRYEGRNGCSQKQYAGFHLLSPVFTKFVQRQSNQMSDPETIKPNLERSS
jgi:hypothetical protein